MPRSPDSNGTPLRLKAKERVLLVRVAKVVVYDKVDCDIRSKRTLKLSSRSSYMRNLRGYIMLSSLSLFSKSYG